MDKVYRIYMTRFGSEQLCGSSLAENERQAVSRFLECKGMDCRNSGNFVAKLDAEQTATLNS